MAALRPFNEWIKDFPCWCGRAAVMTIANARTEGKPVGLCHLHCEERELRVIREAQFGPRRADVSLLGEPPGTRTMPIE